MEFLYSLFSLLKKKHFVNYKSDIVTYTTDYKIIGINFLYTLKLIDELNLSHLF